MVPGSTLLIGDIIGTVAAVCYCVGQAISKRK